MYIRGYLSIYNFLIEKSKQFEDTKKPMGQGLCHTPWEDSKGPHRNIIGDIF